MKDQIIALGEKNQKSLLITNDQVIISSKSHPSVTSLLDATQKKGFLESITVIPVQAIQSISFHENDQNFKIHYVVDGKEKSETIVLDNGSSRLDVVKELSGLRGFSENEEKESKWQPLLLNLLGVVAIPVFTWVFRGMALEAEQGIHYEASGRRSGIKQLLANVVEALGPFWVTVIGVLATLYMVYVTYKRYQQPASKYIFK